eukprot:gene22942-17340_t
MEDDTREREDVWVCHTLSLSLSLLLVRLSIFMHGIARLVDDVDRWATEECGGID